jgi:hypothetical protein
MKMKKWWKIWILCLSLLVASCAGLKKVHVYYDPYTDFSQYMSFYWDESFYQEEGKYVGLLEKQLKNSIHTQMQQRGYSMNPHHPDLLISVEIDVEKKTGYHSVPTSYDGHYGSYGNYTVVPYVYYERTTVLRIIDSRNQLTVWEGMLTSVQQDKVEKKYKKIEKNVSKILSEFEFRATQNLY